MRERTQLEHELQDLGGESEAFSLLDILFGRTRRKDLGFEFDLNYGMESTSPPTSSAGNSIPDDEVLTSHTRSHDGFKVVMDGNRMELSTEAITVEDAMRGGLNTLMTEVMKLVSDLEAGCGGATPITVARPADSIAGTRVLGKPRFFQPGFSKTVGRPVFPLGLNRSETYFRGSCKVYAAPQATMDIPLGSVNALVDAIKKSEGKPPGTALTGSSRYRPGSRSAALFYAQRKVNASRVEHINRKTKLTDGTAVTPRNFSPALLGFMILLVQYLRTSEVEYGPRDYEAFTKAYVPLLSKTLFRDMFHRTLTPTERNVFLELYGNTIVRDKLYALAGRAAGGASRNLFPGKDKLVGRNETHRSRVQIHQDQFFSRRLTWHDLVQMTIDNTPLIADVSSPLTAAERVLRKEMLFTPLANPTNGPPMAGPPAARVTGVRLELRRIGFDWVPATRWTALTERIYDLTRKLNGIR